MAMRRPAHRGAALSLLAALLACAAGSAGAAPRAESALECGVAADMAVVARSLAQEQVQQPKAGAIMSRIYDVAASDRARQLMDDILAAAYSGAQKRSSQKFAQELFAACMKTGGDMDTVLGQRL
jgi:lipopolysaccharide export LptBFGC system permease protein LptF